MINRRKLHVVLDSVVGVSAFLTEGLIVDFVSRSFDSGVDYVRKVKLRGKKAEDLDEISREAGFEWRESGCNMCLGMNPDILMPGERCASTSNRNFEGRQGKGGRTHLVSPQMAAGAAIAGYFVDIREWE